MEPKMYRNVLFNLDRNHVHHLYSQCPPIRTAYQVFLNKEWSKFWTQVTSHRMGLSALISSFIQFNRHKIVSTFALNIPPTPPHCGWRDWSTWSHFQLLTGCGWAQSQTAGIAVTQNWSEGREGCILQSQHEDYPAVNTYLQNIYIPPHSPIGIYLHNVFLSNMALMLWEGGGHMFLVW